MEKAGILSLAPMETTITPAVLPPQAFSLIQPTLIQQFCSSAPRTTNFLAWNIAAYRCLNYTFNMHMHNRPEVNSLQVLYSLF